MKKSFGDIGTISEQNKDSMTIEDQLSDNNQESNIMKAHRLNQKYYQQQQQQQQQMNDWDKRNKNKFNDSKSKDIQIEMENNSFYEPFGTVITSIINPGDSFGQASLIYTIPRNETVYTQEKSLFATLNKIDFMHILKS